MIAQPEPLDLFQRVRALPERLSHGRLRAIVRKRLQRFRRNRFEFAIGIYEGPSPIRLQAARGVRNPVLSRHDVTDRKAAYVADPFMLRVGESWYMFFEVANYGSDFGEIGLATSRDGRAWRYEGIVLSGTFHLSYPHVFAWDGEYYMMPECYQSGGVSLYKAVDFPYRWTQAARLIERPVIVDGTVFRHGDHWWMFAETNPRHTQDCLRLFYSRDLTGPWQEHPNSPIVEGDPTRARPAGRVVRDGGCPIRFAQNCGPEYGTAVRAFRIEELTPQTYREQEVSKDAVLRAGPERWRRFGMHHVDAHELGPGHWLACVDGR